MLRPLGLTEEWSVLDRDDRGDATNTQLCHPELVVTRLCCQHFAKWQNARLAKGLLLFPKISLRCDFREACFMSRAVERVSENIKCKVESVEFWIGQKAFYISSTILHSTIIILHSKRAPPLRDLRKHYPNNRSIRSAASAVASSLAKAVRRKYPSPFLPNPLPGVPTTAAFSSK